MSTTDASRPGEAVPILGAEESPSVPLEFMITREGYTALEELARQLRRDKAQVVSVGLALVDLMLEARSQGGNLAIVGPDGNVKSEIVGL